MKQLPEKKSLFGININSLDYSAVLKICLQAWHNRTSPLSIFFLNAHCYNVAQQNSEYLNAINNSDLLLNDGIGVSIAAKLAGMAFPSNMNGTDLIPFLLEQTAEYSLKVYLLGAHEGHALAAKQHLIEKYPHVQISGYHSGYFDTHHPDEIIADINRSRAEIIVVGMGVPLQELWITEHKHKLTRVKIAIAGGAIIDFLSGSIKRAPLWMRALKLEWLYRLEHEPVRLFNRYVFGNCIFLLTILFKYIKMITLNNKPEKISSKKAHYKTR